PDWGNDNIREIILGGYSISPALPTGLVFDRISGSISGTPTVVSASTNYSVIARNLSGAPTTPLYLAVNPPAGFNPSQNLNYIITFTPRVPAITNNAALNTASGDMNQVEIGIQYFDGLGRPMQNVQVKGSPTARDIVQPIAYDEFSREVNKYLHYSAATVGDGSYKATALTDQPAFYTNPTSASWSAPGVVQMPGQDAQATTVYEPSPLNRVVEQGAPGADWQPVAGSTTGRTVKIVYTNNNTTPLTDTTNSYYVALYRVTVNSDGSRTLTQGSGAAAYYAAGQLYVTVSYDENWTSGRGGSTEEYKDKEGRIVLKRTYNYIAGTSPIFQVLSTYYVYDDLGNLAFVLPPLSGADAGLPSQATLNNLCYQYGYDGRNRQMTKKLPGKGVEEMVYNQLDQLLYQRDANERNAGQWEFTKHDALGRVIITGITKDTSSRAPLQSYVTNMITLTDTVGQWEVPTTVNGIQGYTDTAFPWGNNQILLKVNYYDNYTFQGQPATAVAPTVYSNMTKGLLTASKMAVLNTINNTTLDMLWDVQYYDDLGRATQTYAQHYLGGVLSPNNYDVITNAYDYPDFVHELSSTTRQNYGKNTNNTASTLNATIVNNYKYDQVERKTQTWESIT
ncbi:DUF6443 domain-containing protein, partial [Mucilaginibacter frigoritolerans]|uniref:DUF6443 domain-containing protein n=1 Tax=Mucilaginibacter frigoritolerans TaxID=652788 RepID=UPI001B85EBDF